MTPTPTPLPSRSLDEPQLSKSGQDASVPDTQRGLPRTAPSLSPSHTRAVSPPPKAEKPPRAQDQVRSLPAQGAGPRNGRGLEVIQRILGISRLCTYPSLPNIYQFCIRQVMSAVYHWEAQGWAPEEAPWSLFLESKQETLTHQTALSLEDGTDLLPSSICSSAQRMKPAMRKGPRLAQQICKP